MAAVHGGLHLPDPRAACCMEPPLSTEGLSSEHSPGLRLFLRLFLLAKGLTAEELVTRKSCRPGGGLSIAARPKLLPQCLGCAGVCPPATDFTDQSEADISLVTSASSRQPRTPDQAQVSLEAPGTGHSWPAVWGCFLSHPEKGRDEQPHLLQGRLS